MNIYKKIGFFVAKLIYIKWILHLLNIVLSHDGNILLVIEEKIGRETGKCTVFSKQVYYLKNGNDSLFISIRRSMFAIL